MWSTSPQRRSHSDSRCTWVPSSKSHANHSLVLFTLKLFLFVCVSKWWRLANFLICKSHWSSWGSPHSRPSYIQVVSFMHRQRRVCNRCLIRLKLPFDSRHWLWSLVVVEHAAQNACRMDAMLLQETFSDVVKLVSHQDQRVRVRKTPPPTTIAALLS